MPPSKDYSGKPNYKYWLMLKYHTAAATEEYLQTLHSDFIKTKRKKSSKIDYYLRARAHSILFLLKVRQELSADIDKGGKTSYLYQVKFGKKIKNSNLGYYDSDYSFTQLCLKFSPKS